MNCSAYRNKHLFVCLLIQSSFIYLEVLKSSFVYFDLFLGIQILLLENKLSISLSGNLLYTFENIKL